MKDTFHLLSKDAADWSGAMMVKVVFTKLQSTWTRVMSVAATSVRLSHKIAKTCPECGHVFLSYHILRTFSIQDILYAPIERKHLKMGIYILLFQSIQKQKKLSWGLIFLFCFLKKITKIKNHV